MSTRIRLSVPVLLFPEGTSTDGNQVLRFYPRLFQPAIEAQTPVTEAAISYRPVMDADEREICWFGDAAFVVHLWKLLGQRGVHAHIRFGRPHVYADARIAAQSTHAAIVDVRARMKASRAYGSLESIADHSLMSL